MTPIKFFFASFGFMEFLKYSNKNLVHYFLSLESSLNIPFLKSLWNDLMARKLWKIPIVLFLPILSSCLEQINLIFNHFGTASVLCKLFTIIICSSLSPDPCQYFKKWIGVKRLVSAIRIRFKLWRFKGYVHFTIQCGFLSGEPRMKNFVKFFCLPLKKSC